MQRTKITATQVGLVFKMGALVRVLTQGKYWLWWGESVKIFDTRQPIVVGNDLDLYLENEDFRSMVNLVELEDNEIALHYKNGNFFEVLKPGRYAFWADVVNQYFDIYDLNDFEVATSIQRKVLATLNLRMHLHKFEVSPFEKGLLFVDGKFQKTLDPGVYHFWKNQSEVELKKADLRKQMMEVSGQELLTKDKAAIRLNCYANFQIEDIDKALVDTKDYSNQLYLQLQLALRTYVGTQTLDMLLANKEAVAPFVAEAVKSQAAEMGIVLHSTGIRDIILPGDVKEIMNQVLVAEKKAQANVIMRREETASTRSLLNTAKLMEDNDMLYRLKEMEFMEKIAANVHAISLSGGGKVMDELKGLFGKG